MEYMSTNQKLQFSSTSSEQSLAWGKKLGQSLSLGQLIEFVGDLGGGKTTIIKGIAASLGVSITGSLIGQINTHCLSN